MICAAALGLALVAYPASGHQQPPEALVQPEAPLPALTGRVVDKAGLLSAPASAALADRLAALEAATTDQLVVATVHSLGGRSIEAFGLALGNSWGVGRNHVHNGVLLIVAPAERRVRIEVGLGLESVLTDERAAVIVQATILPFYRRGEMEAGTIAGADAIIAVLRASPVRKAVAR